MNGHQDSGGVAARPGEIVGHHPVDMSVFEGSGDREKQHEKEQRPPVHLLLDVVAGAVLLQDHHDSGADQRGDQQHTVLGESEEVFQRMVRRDREDGQRDQQQPLLIGNFHQRRQRQPLRETVLELHVEFAQLAAEVEQRQPDCREQRDQHERKRPKHEVAEGQHSLGPDVDADRIAHHGPALPTLVQSTAIRMYGVGLSFSRSQT